MKQLFSTLLLCLSLGTTLLAQESLTISGTNDLKLRFDGRITLDGAVYLPASDLENVKYGADDFRFSNSATVSQLRLGLVANLGSRWIGRFDADFSNRRVNLTDIFVRYNIDSRRNLTMGYYKDPVSMENNTGSRHLSLQTPMAVSALTRGERYLGVTYIQYGDRYWFSGGVYAGTVSSRLTEANRGSDGYGIAARGAILPIKSEYSTLHLGAYARWRTPEPSDATPTGAKRVVYSALPESSIDAHRFVGATVDGVKSYVLGGLELAGTFNKWFVTGEVLYTNLFRDTQNSFLYGWTTTVSYMLRGKQRRYLASEGYFSPVASVERGGSLELIGRAGQLNMNDIQGGEAYSLLLGLNWYPRANVLLGLNYTYMDHNDTANAGGMINPIPAGGIDFHTIQARLQFVF